MKPQQRWLWAVLLVSALAEGATAEVGAAAEFAAVQGEVQWTRASGRAVAQVGESVSVGDRIRTGAAQRVKLVILDAGVLDIAPNTELAIDELSAVREVQRLAFAARLFRGRILVRTTPGFARGASHCLVETGSASVAVPDGETVIRYDPEDEFTEVVTLSGEVEVTAKVEAMAGGRVRLTDGLAVRVARGRLPQVPAAWGVERARQYAADIELFGTGRRDGLNVLHPLTLGRLLDPSDVPGAPAPQWLGAQAPSVPLPQFMSEDVYTNTQPIEVFRVFRPGYPLTGDVRVDF
ncbi:MAG: FecR family protein [Candidatus Binatia bacterium]|nr:FecR family protein [Candidatus Binatia bacterium]